MPIADLIGKVFSSQIVAGVTQVTPILSLARDRSAEVAASGDGLNIANVGSLVSVQDYPASGDISYAGLSPNRVQLDLDKHKYVAAELEDIADAQLAFDLMAETARQSGEKLSAQVAADFRALFAATTPTETYAYDGPSGTFTQANLQQVVDLLLPLTAQVRTAGYGSGAWLLLHPAMWILLMQYFTHQTGSFNVQGGQLTDQAFTDGMLSNIFGLQVIVDWGAGTTVTASANRPFHSYAGITNRTLTYAQQVRVVERFRSPDRFADRYRVLVNYGMAVQDNSLFRVSVT